MTATSGVRSETRRAIHSSSSYSSARIERLLILVGVLNVIGMAILSWRTEMVHHHHDNTNRAFGMRSGATTSSETPRRQTSNPLYTRNYTLHRLRQLGISIDSLNSSMQRHLPPWQHVVDQYGEEPVILGLEEGWCNTILSTSTSTPLLRMAPTGLFHSGTHLLYDLLRTNCHLDQEDGNIGDRVLFQPQSGKHTPYEYRNIHRVGSLDEDGRNESLQQHYTLPLVTIRHPYDWFARMCAVPYAANWTHSPKHCPNLIDDKSGGGVPVTIHYGAGSLTYDSLAHVWNRWYRSYFDSLEPRIVIRLEDLMFYPDVVANRLCECLGVRANTSSRGSASVAPRRQFQARLTSSKEDYTGHGSVRMGLLDTWIRYGWKRGSYQHQWSKKDLQAARRILDRDMMEAFGYRHPTKSSY